VWNEPELSFPQRSPTIDSLVCYCIHCVEKFRSWLRDRYKDLESLNSVWGRCYETWDEVEAARSPETIVDFVDWRMFQVDVITEEAAWRYDLVRRADPDHVAYLHVVPNTGAIFNTIGCATDDHALARTTGDIFAASTNGSPEWLVPFVSAGRNSVLWNVESHVNGGTTALHQAPRQLSDLLVDWIPQIGAGVTGFMFWQFRPESLGFESPAWGVIRSDGADRPVTTATARFRELLGGHADALTRCRPSVATVGIWHSLENEVFSWSIHGSQEHFVRGQEGWLNAAMSSNLPIRFVPSCDDLDGIRLLIMPSPYLLSANEAEALGYWVEAGGVLISEAHLGAYDRDRGRHSSTVPGHGLAARFGIREAESMASWHLAGSETSTLDGGNGDVNKAFASGVVGSVNVPVTLSTGGTATGRLRYAEIEAPLGTVLGTSHGVPLIVERKVGKGTVIYIGTDLGASGKISASGLQTLLTLACREASIEMPSQLDGARIGVLESDGKTRYVTLVNESGGPLVVGSHWQPLRGVFTGVEWLPNAPLTVADRFADLFVVIEDDPANA
jgi:beta-galactosidase